MKRELDPFESVGAAFEPYRDNAKPLAVALVMTVVVAIATLGLGLPPLALGWAQLALRGVRGETLDDNDLMLGFKRFGTAWKLGLLLVAGVLALELPTSVLILPFVGLQHQKVPGQFGLHVVIAATIAACALRLVAVWLAIAWVWANLRLADGETDARQAFGFGLRANYRFWVRVIWFAMVLTTVALLGALALGVGLLASLPLTALALAHGYDVRLKDPPRVPF